MTPRALHQARDTLILHGYEPLPFARRFKPATWLAVRPCYPALLVRVGRPDRVPRHELVRLARESGCVPIVAEDGAWWRLSGKRPGEREEWTWET